MIQEREMAVAVRVVSRCLGGEGKVKEVWSRVWWELGPGDCIQ